MWELFMGQKSYVYIHYETVIGVTLSHIIYLWDSKQHLHLVLESCDYEWRSLMEKYWLTEPSKRPCFIKIA
ncbi:hypothetical protein IEQ34_016955 [Dendrobium chrysotoxum]|uniref:Uncharacterized protein n=1 Tax=Dendrobium chrysotoxum TaxID=161865 RepID=A0AAV7GG38_DENCH|nr:hypothetical protein IEQ34_016955 [Dendrobium chrysotoxum]